MDFLNAGSGQLLVCQRVEIRLPAAAFIGFKTVGRMPVRGRECVPDIVPHLERRLRDGRAEPGNKIACRRLHRLDCIGENTGHEAAPTTVCGGNFIAFIRAK